MQQETGSKLACCSNAMGCSESNQCNTESQKLIRGKLCNKVCEYEGYI